MGFCRCLGHNYDVKTIATYVVVEENNDQWQAEEKAWEKVEKLYKNKHDDIAEYEPATDKIEYAGNGKYHVWIDVTHKIKTIAHNDDKAIESAEDIVRKIDYPNCMARLYIDSEIESVESEPALDIILEDE